MKTLRSCAFAFLALIGAAAPDEARADHDKKYTEIAISPDGKLIASIRGAYTIREVRIFAAADGKRIATLPSDKLTAMFIAFSPTGSALAAAGHDGRIVLISPSSGAIERQVFKLDPSLNPSPELPADRVHLEGLAFTADGKSLVVAGPDDSARVVDVASGKVTRRIEAALPAAGDLGIDGAGRIALAPGGDEDDEPASAYLFDPATGKKALAIPFELSGADAIALGGRRAIVDTGLDVVLFDTTAATAKELLRCPLVDAQARKKKPIPVNERVPALAVSPDGTRAAFLRMRTEPGKALEDCLLSIVFLDATAGKVLSERPSPDHRYFDSAAFTPDGKALVIGGDSTLLLLDVASGKTLRTFGGDGE